MGSVRRHRKVCSDADSLVMHFNNRPARFSSIPYMRGFTKYNRNGSDEMDTANWFKQPDGFWVQNERSDFKHPYKL